MEKEKYFSKIKRAVSHLYFIAQKIRAHNRHANGVWLFYPDPVNPLNYGAGKRT
jgi:hypothetical protein